VLKLKKWRRVTHGETGISCEVGRLVYSQKPLLAAMIADVFGAVLSLRGEDGTAREGVSVEETTAALRTAFGKLDGEMIEKMFRDKVRDVQGLETEDGPVTTGVELLEVADQGLVMWALQEIVSSSDLSVDQGKAFASPSTLPPEKTLDSGSPAESTGSAGGATPSTAEATPTESESSSQVA